MLRVISLGAGVQSTTMALMAAHGELTPMPDTAIFADTGWEPKAVYEHLRWLMLPNVLPFPVHVVSAGNIREHLVTGKNARTGGHYFIGVPFFLQKGNKLGMGRRQCTSHYKIEPISRKLRELLGVQPRVRVKTNSVEVWIGISTDEAMRMKPAKASYQINRWPLIEKGISRRDCLAWLARNGYPIAPKSSCIGCPFHNDNYWRDMRDNSPKEWHDAIFIDRIIRKTGKGKGDQFMHASRIPLDQVDLSTPEDHGQLDLFNNECEGMCGV